MVQALPTGDDSGPKALVPDFTFRAVNFKSIASVELPMTRLTVLAGSNSSGKSSLLQAALFLAQSIRAGACVINGDLVHLGEPKDVIRDGADELTFEFSFRQQLGQTEGEQHVTLGISLREDANRFQPHRLTLVIDGEAKLAAEKSDCPADLRELLGPREEALKISNPGKFELPENSFITVVGVEPGRLVYNASADDARPTFSELIRGPAAPYLLDEIALGSTESKFGHRLPDSLLDKVQQIRREGQRPKRKQRLSSEEIEALLPLYMDKIAPAGWGSEGISLPPLGGPSALFRQSLFSLQSGERSPIFPTVARMTQASKRMHKFASSVVHLGPLREDPRVAYPLGHTIANLPVGEKGEFTAAYLESHKGRVIPCRDAGQNYLRDSLLGAASKWSRHLGIADKVSVQSKGKLGYELSLELDGCDRDPTAIGVGASQLLPVVVTVLGADPGQLILLEQPELHLHPKVQSQLADFFAWARPDVQLLIETHSEYLVTRIRRRVAEGRVNHRDLAMLFVEKRSMQASLADGEGESSLFKGKGAYSDFRQLHLDELGDFDFWPEDFFDALDKDLVGLAQAVSKRLEPKSQSDSRDV